MNLAANTVAAVSSSPDWARVSTPALWADMIAARRSDDDAAYFAARRAFWASAPEASDVIVSDFDGLSPVVDCHDHSRASLAREWIRGWWTPRQFSFDAEAIRVERCEDQLRVEVRIFCRTKAGEAEGTVTLREDGEGGFEADVDRDGDLDVADEVAAWASGNLVDLLRVSNGMNMGAGHADLRRFGLAVRRLEDEAIKAALAVVS